MAPSTTVHSIPDGLGANTARGTSRLTRHKISCGGEGGAARTRDIEAISDVNRKAYRRQLHRLVRWATWHTGHTPTRVNGYQTPESPLVRIRSDMLHVQVHWDGLQV
jgi:hypothetical protein